MLRGALPWRSDAMASASGIDGESGLMADWQHGAASPGGDPEARSGPPDPGVLIYERLLPAIPESVGRVRRELLVALARHQLAPARASDIGLLVSEAATNAVLHAYRQAPPGPLYVSAILVGDGLTISVCDCGSGLQARTDSPGLGVGIALMTRLSDELDVSSEPAQGTCVHATFESPAPASWRQPDTAGDQRGQMLGEYVRLLHATHAQLAEDTDAAIAQARQTLAHVRQRRAARRGTVARRTTSAVRGGRSMH
jgi:anti-sigma regulatory factor (Ser/Thr protein kinase)